MKINKKIFLMALAAVLGLAPEAKAQNGMITVARAFYELARQNNTAKISNLLNRGYSLESVDEHGYNPVCLSVLSQNKQAYNILRQHGANQSPECLKKIPADTYKNFFGTTPIRTVTYAATNTSDTPYLIGAAVLGAGAVATAYILRGELDNGGSGGGGGGGGGGGDCSHGTKDPTTGKCECDSGYGNYGDDTACYATIPNCAIQSKNKCTACAGAYSLEDNVCYAPIENCKTQKGSICQVCDSGYGVHGGNGTRCYEDIEFCRVQDMTVCSACVDGYDTYGDVTHCYQSIENCMTQVKTVCVHCNDGYDTWGNPEKNRCFPTDPCPDVSKVPALVDNEVVCICNEAKGYYDDGGECKQAEEGEYQEGEGNQEQWNNLNELYCNSHGKYNPSTGLCTCYTGYTNESCSECATDYMMFDGRCYLKLDCDPTQHFEQNRDACVCQTGYTLYEEQCVEIKDCPIHYKQQGSECVCKDNYDETCTTCLDGYTYNPLTDECVKDAVVCEEKWQGEECNVCPLQYEVTVDGSGKKHCGNKCAANRAPIEDNPDCSECGEGYKYSQIDNNCVVTECTSGVDGYIEIDGVCTCDREQGYAMGLLGKCVLKGEDLIGIKDANVNNSVIELNNDGNIDEIRDVYGMKPVASDDGEGHVEYYDNVYNALSSSGNREGTIDITNANVGGNLVYGIYSPSAVYNAASVVESQNVESNASGNIIIKDSNSYSHIYGMANDSEASIYNAFAYNSAQGSAEEATESVATGSINISKDEDSDGKIIGISGKGNILNAYADTDGGTAANVTANGIINLTDEGKGSVIGIEGTGVSKKINNALSYLNSAISDVSSEGIIKIEGNGDLRGISGAGTIANSETQFNRSFTKVNDFGSKGLIEVTSNAEGTNAYGIYLGSQEKIKAEIYNALGYNSIGDILVKSKNGGNIYGIWHGIKLYEKESGGIIDEYYNNTYNAFRSSAKYGDDESYAEGTITLEMSGNTNRPQVASGIYSEGNVFNAYAKSGSDVELRTIGNIIVNDNSTTGNTVKGIESGGATIANAYAEGVSENTKTKVEGNINMNLTGAKNSASGLVAGIFTDQISSMTTKVYNAALIEAKSNVEGKINIIATSKPTNLIYGIYASKYPMGGSAEEGQEKTVYNAYYDNLGYAPSEGSVNGLISIKTNQSTWGSTSDYYGIFVNEGIAYNAYSTSPAANVIGTIDIDVAGGDSGGTAAGMYGFKSELHNNGANSIIKVTADTADAYGMKAEGAGTYVENTGTINAISKRRSAYGLYINQGQVINGAEGVLNVAGYKGGYGIYAIAKNSLGQEVGTAEVVNNGTINVDAYINENIQPSENPNARNVGIYAEGSNVTVKNTGTININGSPNNNVCQNGECENVKNIGIMLLEDAQLDNGGSITSTGSMNLDDMGKNIYLSTGGSFSAEDELSGNLKIATSVVQDTFDHETTLNDALSAQNISNLNVTSQSYLYNANVVANDAGKYDVVMQMKDFLDITDDKSWANYLRQNYENQKNIALFNALRNASNATQAQMDEANIKGSAMLPNITEEELKVQRSLDKSMMNELFKGNDDIRKIVGADAMRVGKDDHGTLTGYDINSQSMYTLYDKKLDNRYRLGLGLSFTHTNTDYNNDSTRKNFMVQGYVPLTYNVGNGVTAVSMAKVGYADGEYKRIGYDNKSYKADTSAVTYGLLNELRYTKDVGFVKLTPFVGLNATGWYQKSINEGQENLALHMDATNVFSLESALGMYVDKAIEFNQDNILNLALGLGYYHEFADPYRGIDAHLSNSVGNFRIKNKLNSRDRGILSAKAEYDYKDFSIYGELMQYLEKEYPIEVEGGIKYRF